MASLFGRRSPSAVAVVDAPLSVSFARKARIAFLAVAGVVGVLTAAVVGMFGHPVVAMLIGIAAGLMSGLAVAAVVVVWPVLRALWWWSLEIAVVALVVLAPAWLARATSPWLALPLVLVVTAGCAGVGPVRRWLVAWSWCVVVRHRLRTCFAEFVRAATRSRGSLPLLLWACPTPAGERVWLWLRPGLDLTDLEGKTGKVAVTCWAGEARVVRASARFAALIRVDLARRDPLAQVVASPLAALIGHLRSDDAVAPVSPGMPPVGLDLADVPESVSVPPPRGGRR